MSKISLNRAKSEIFREVCKSQKISRFANFSNKNSKNKFFGTFNFFKVEVFENSSSGNELFKFLFNNFFKFGEEDEQERTGNH